MMMAFDIEYDDRYIFKKKPKQILARGLLVAQGVPMERRKNPLIIATDKSYLQNEILPGSSSLPFA